METYRITKSDIAELFEPGARVADLFQWLEKDFNTQKKLVCQFIINGQELSESEELDWAAKPFEMINSLDVRVQDEKSLVLDVIQAWIEAIPELVDFIEKKLTTTHEGVRKFRVEDIFEFIDQQESFVESMMSIKIALKRLKIPSAGWDQAEKELHAYVSQCVKHLESKNFVQLIETLEYDGAHNLETWRQLLVSQKGEVESLNGQSKFASAPVPAQFEVAAKKGDSKSG
ncbi:MAG: hypothetical protein ACK5Y2_09850 [Bdellovibrionales bacterium]